MSDIMPPALLHSLPSDLIIYISQYLPSISIIKLIECSKETQALFKNISNPILFSKICFINFRLLLNTVKSIKSNTFEIKGFQTHRLLDIPNNISVKNAITIVPQNIDDITTLAVINNLVAKVPTKHLNIYTKSISLHALIHTTYHFTDIILYSINTILTQPSIKYNIPPIVKSLTVHIHYLHSRMTELIMFDSRSQFRFNARYFACLESLTLISPYDTIQFCGLITPEILTLKSLHLRNIIINGNCLENYNYINGWIKWFDAIPFLTHITLENCTIDNDIFSKFLHSHKLTHISITDCLIKNIDYLELFYHYEELETLILKYNTRRSSRDPRVIDYIPNLDTFCPVFKNLKHLEFSGTLSCSYGLTFGNSSFPAIQTQIIT